MPRMRVWESCSMSLLSCSISYIFPLFFFNDTATTEIYTLSLHDALPISGRGRHAGALGICALRPGGAGRSLADERDRKSTRLNSSHSSISYAVFYLKKKNVAHPIFGHSLLNHV